MEKPTMNKNIKIFLEKFAQDTDLQEKLKKMNSFEEAYELAKNVQDGFTKEEFVETMTTIQKQMQKSL